MRNTRLAAQQRAAAYTAWVTTAECAIAQHKRTPEHLNYVDPFIVCDQPTPAEIAEYLRHSNAQFALDAATAQRHRAERETQ